MSKENQPDYLITIPKRGLRIVPPPETMEKMARARLGERVGLWSEEEKARLKLIVESSILKKRYPTARDGKEFMQWVDYDRQIELVDYAQEMGDCIIEKWEEINPQKPIAVILYGSTTRGLVKAADHPDPSNIDLSVIGDINEEERLNLFDAIRQKRCEIHERILLSCKNVSHEMVEACGNAGVHIQHVDKLKVNNYCCALEYIKARATPLFDPTNIWGEIEKEALDFKNAQYKKEAMHKALHLTSEQFSK